jgi:hypothetical protein
MNRKILPVVAVLTGAVVMFASSTAGAFTKLSPERIWFALPVEIDYNTAQVETSISDGDNGVTAIVDMLNNQNTGWDSAVPNTDLVFGYTSNLAAVQGDGFPTIEMNDPINICTGGCLAATLTGFFVQQAGVDEIVDADVYVTTQVSFTTPNEDSAASCSNNEFEITGVMLHEVGHVIGLGHSTRQKATMFASVSPCDFRTRSLAADDRNGADSLY